MRYVPVTPAGTTCPWLQASTEEQAWQNILRAIPGRPYQNIEALKRRGYKVEPAK